MKLFLITLFMIFSTSVLVVAQLEQEPPTGIPPPDPKVVPVTGLEYLLLAGGAYGIYRHQRRRKKNKEA